MLDTMFADDLMRQGARASAAMVLEIIQQYSGFSTQRVNSVHIIYVSVKETIISLS